uniref:Solute carrier family 22 member 18-like n=1 Tax=Coturnix japonica TaxID=93934 RepID=A0A8C2TER8_COTJA
TQQSCGSASCLPAAAVAWVSLGAMLPCSAVPAQGLAPSPANPKLSYFLSPRKQGNDVFSLFYVLSELVSIHIRWTDSAHVFHPQVVQGLVIGKLTSHCTEQTLLRFSILLFAGVGLGMALMRTVWHYCIIVVPLVFAFNVQGTITDSILTKAVSSSDTGAMLGICASVQPLTRTVGPTLGVILYRQFGVSSFGYLQLIVNAGLFERTVREAVPPKARGRFAGSPV